MTGDIDGVIRRVMTINTRFVAALLNTAGHPDTTPDQALLALSKARKAVDGDFIKLTEPPDGRWSSAKALLDRQDATIAELRERLRDAEDRASDFVTVVAELKALTKSYREVCLERNALRDEPKETRQMTIDSLTPDELSAALTKTLADAQRRADEADARAEEAEIKLAGEAAIRDLVVKEIDVLRERLVRGPNRSTTFYAKATETVEPETVKWVPDRELNEAEASWIALLSFEWQTVQQLVTASKYSRNTVRKAMDNLVERDLARVTRMNGAQVYALPLSEEEKARQAARPRARAKAAS